MRENEMDTAQKIFIATIYGEAAISSPAAWLAIASVILNRVGIREWKRHTTPLAVIQETGFDAYTDTNAPFLRALRCLETGQLSGAKRLVMLMDLVSPSYLAGKGTVPEIVMYYSPKAQRLLHAARPDKWRASPAWDFGRLEMVTVPGTEADDFAFYKYKSSTRPAPVVTSDVPPDEPA